MHCLVELLMNPSPRQCSMLSLCSGHLPPSGPIQLSVEQFIVVTLPCESSRLRVSRRGAHNTPIHSVSSCGLCFTKDTRICCIYEHFCECEISFIFTYSPCSIRRLLESWPVMRSLQNSPPPHWRILPINDPDCSIWEKRFIFRVSTNLAKSYSVK